MAWKIIRNQSKMPAVPFSLTDITYSLLGFGLFHSPSMKSLQIIYILLFPVSPRGVCLTRHFSQVALENVGIIDLGWRYIKQRRFLNQQSCWNENVCIRCICWPWSQRSCIEYCCDLGHECGRNFMRQFGCAMFEEHSNYQSASDPNHILQAAAHTQDVEGWTVM